jgi:antitoxin component YwqK of YwqJK toxin-antitoxin module
MGESIEYEEEAIDYDEDSSPVIDGRPLTGIVKHREVDGTIFMTISYENGIRHGPMRIYFPDGGGPRVEYPYRSGMLEGVGRAWHENGQLRAEVVYKTTRVVSSREWDANGKEIIPARPDPIERL